MKYAFFHVQTSVDQEAADACGWTPNPEAPNEIPAPLAQIDCATVLVLDCGRGASRSPHSVDLQQYCRSESMTEAQLLNKLDLDLILASIEPGSQVFCEDATATLIYRTTKHRLDPLILSGEQTGDGRALGQVIDPVVPAGQPRPTFRQQAAGRGIPYSLAANLVSDDDPAWEHKFGQISVRAMALVALLLYSPDATRIADATWAVMADWIEADPNAPTGSRRSRVAEGYSRGSLFDPLRRG